MTLNPKCSSTSELDALCNEIDTKLSKGFDDLITKCNIDINKNKSLSDEFYSLVKSNTKLQKQIKALKIGRWFLIIFLIFPFILMTKAAKKKEKLLSAGAKSENETQTQLDSQIHQLNTEISYDFCFNKMVEPIWKDIDFDVFQDASTFKPWKPLIDKILPKDSCFTCMVSGTLFGNPFMVYNYKHQDWVPKVYSASVPVHYETFQNGHTVHGTELVFASETIPAPVWTTGTELAYHFEKAKNLCFSNYTSKRDFKKWNKKNQTPMENKNFDKVFPAIRNDEKDYRVVFTPLAQENFVKLFNDEKYLIKKEEEVTMVALKDGNHAYLDVTPNEAFHYNVHTWRDNYVKWVHNFVNNVGLLTLPIACIPLYTQFQNSNTPSSLMGASDMQVQDNLSFLFDLYQKWNDFETDVIFETGETKTLSIDKTKFSITKVVCHYFWPDHQIVTKPAVSAHGISAMVPIPVIYYRPRKHNIYVCQSVDLNPEVVEKQLGSNMVIHRGQLMFICNGEISPTQTSYIKTILKEFKKKV